MSKQKLALAYGFQDERSILRRINEKVNMLSDEELLQLGKYTGHGHLLPDQIEIIVRLLGNPEDPSMVFAER